MPKQTIKKTLTPVDIRYRATRNPIKSKLHLHFADRTADLEERGGLPDTEKLKTYMGVTYNRWEQLKHGAEPTLAEAAAYADYMQLDIAELYTLIPYSTKNK
jgi:hypothetical protein